MSEKHQISSPSTLLHNDHSFTKANSNEMALRCNKLCAGT